MLHCYSPRQSFLSLQGRPHRPKRRRTPGQRSLCRPSELAGPGRRHTEHRGTGPAVCRPSSTGAQPGQLRSAEAGLGAAAVPEQAPLGQPGSPRPRSSRAGRAAPPASNPTAPQDPAALPGWPGRAPTGGSQRLTCAPRVSPRPLSCPWRSWAKMLVFAARAPAVPVPGPVPPPATAAMASALGTQTAIPPLGPLRPARSRGAQHGGRKGCPPCGREPWAPRARRECCCCCSAPCRLQARPHCRRLPRWPLGFLYVHRDSFIPTGIPLFPSARPSHAVLFFKEKLAEEL